MQPERSIAMAVKNLSNQFHRYMTGMKREVAAAVGDAGRITDIQGRIVHYLYTRRKDGVVYQKDVERHFNIRRSTATDILKRIERNGLIRREASGIDARMKTVTLTERAEALCPRARLEILKAERQAAKGLSEAELAQFFRIVETIGRNIA